MRIHRDLYGNGVPGMVPKMEAFLTKHETLEQERDKQHKQNRGRMNIIIALLGLLIGVTGTVAHIMQQQQNTNAHIPIVER